MTEQGRDGLAGTADDQRMTVYSLNPGFTLVEELTINDDRLGVKYTGMEIVGTKRYGRGTTELAGPTSAMPTIRRSR